MYRELNKRRIGPRICTISVSLKNVYTSHCCSTWLKSKGMFKFTTWQRYNGIDKYLYFNYINCLKLCWDWRHYSLVATYYHEIVLKRNRITCNLNSYFICWCTFDVSLTFTNTSLGLETMVCAVYLYMFLWNACISLQGYYSCIGAIAIFSRVQWSIPERQG